MDITEEGQTWVELDDHLHIQGVNHFEEDAYEVVVENIQSYAPELVAVEDYPEKLVLSQLSLIQEDMRSETGVLLTYALKESVPLATLDTDWSDVEFIDGTQYTDYIEEAYNAADFDEDKFADVSFREYDDANDALAEYDPMFYRRFVADRDQAMAAHLYWLLTNYETTPIFATMGIGHIDNVLDIMHDINAGAAQTEPIEPTIYDADDLHDLVLSDDEVSEKVMETGQILMPGQVPRLRDQYQDIADHIAENVE